MGIDLRFTDKQITARGGMATMKRMLDHLGSDAALTAAKPPQPKSNRGYRPEQLITQIHALDMVWRQSVQNRIEPSGFAMMVSSALESRWVNSNLKPS